MGKNNIITNLLILKLWKKRAQLGQQSFGLLQSYVFYNMYL